MQMNGQRQMETRSASDVAQLPRNTETLPQEALRWKRKIIIPPRTGEQIVASRGRTGYCDWKSKGLNLALGPDANAVTSRPAVDDLSVQRLTYLLRLSATAVPGMVCGLRQSSHIIKKRLRLADEQPHIR